MKGNAVRTMDDLQVSWLSRREDGRPTKDAGYLAVAHTLGAMGDCRRRGIGAVIVRDDVPISWGYNGTTPGAPGCLEGKCRRGVSDVPAYAPYGDCIAIHAEVNAINSAIREGRDLTGSTIYVSAAPCTDCAAAIENTPISRIVVNKPLVSDGCGHN